MGNSQSFFTDQNPFSYSAHEGEPDTLLACSTCELTFQSRSLLHEHVLSHSAPPVTPVELHCGVCDKTFTNMAALNTHSREHTKVQDLDDIHHSPFHKLMVLLI